MKLCFDVSIDSCFFTNGNFTSWKVAFCFRRNLGAFQNLGKGFHSNIWYISSFMNTGLKSYKQNGVIRKSVSEYCIIGDRWKKMPQPFSILRLTLSLIYLKKISSLSKSDISNSGKKTSYQQTHVLDHSQIYPTFCYYEVTPLNILLLLSCTAIHISK